MVTSLGIRPNNLGKCTYYSMLSFSRGYISIIPNGIDCQRMDRKLTESVPLNLQRSPILLTVGGVSPKSDILHGTLYAPALHTEWLTPRIVFGKSVIQRYGNKLHIVFHGVCPTWEKLTEYYKAADLFMLLSENQKNAIHSLTVDSIRNYAYIFTFPYPCGNNRCRIMRYCVIVSGKFSLWIGLWLRLRFFYRDLHILGILHGSEVKVRDII